MIFSFYFRRSVIVSLFLSILLSVGGLISSPAKAYYQLKSCATIFLPPATSPSTLRPSLPFTGAFTVRLPYCDTATLNAEVVQDDGIPHLEGLQGAYQIKIPAQAIVMTYNYKESTHALTKYLEGERYTLLMFTRPELRNEFMANPLPDQRIEVILGEGELDINGTTYFTAILGHGQYQTWAAAQTSAAETDPTAIKEIFQNFYLEHYTRTTAHQRKAYYAEERQWEENILAILDNRTALDLAQEKAVADNLKALLDRRMEELSAAKNFRSFLSNHSLKNNDLALAFWQTRRHHLTSYHPQDWNYKYHALTFMLDGQMLSLFYPPKVKVLGRQLLEIFIGRRLANHPKLRAYLRASIISSNGLPLHQGRYRVTHSNLSSMEYVAFARYLYRLTLMAN